MADTQTQHPAVDERGLRSANSDQGERMAMGTTAAIAKNPALSPASLPDPSFVPDEMRRRPVAQDKPIDVAPEVQAVANEIFAIESLMATDRRAYTKSEVIQARYRELIDKTLGH